MALSTIFSWLTIVVASVGLASSTTCKRQSISPLSPDQVFSFAPFTHFAAAAFCDPLLILSWSCGEHCEANPSFELVDSGGDGIEVQYWFVGYDPDHDTAIVAHQGTNVTYILSILTDLKLVLSGLDPGLFPRVPSSVKVHSGFSKDQARTAPMVLSAVRDVISKYNTTSVTTVGHSLGAALSLLDSVYLRLQLPADIGVRAILYGLPRVGNRDWANFVDAHLPGNVTHVNNKYDPIPILPGRFIKYHHPSGEIHIDDTDAWDVCPGQDNPSKMCIVGAVPNLFHSNWRDHDGPYGGIGFPCTTSLLTPDTLTISAHF
ncbi:Alpha/Beta hydrolase protein [Lactarius indigo]|nr:Alpha/Beta hydrolase protein [Lactarius indigo]